MVSHTHEYKRIHFKKKKSYYLPQDKVYLNLLQKHSTLGLHVVPFPLLPERAKLYLEEILKLKKGAVRLDKNKYSSYGIVINGKKYIYADGGYKRAVRSFLNSIKKKYGV